MSEGGIHKVQRVSVTSKKDKMHTSTVSVAVLKEEQGKAIDITSKDIEIDTFRGSGNGGQHRNTTDSAVRVKHISSGMVVECENERSQWQNKAVAIEVLRKRLEKVHALELAKRSNDDRRTQVGSGDRAEARRNYNYIRSEVVDNVSGKKAPLKEILQKANINLLK